MVSIKIDFSLILQIVNFLLLMIALNHFLYRPIREILRERRAKFASYENDIKKMTGNIQDRLNEIDARLTDAKRDGFSKKDELKSEGLEEEKRIIGVVTGETSAEIERIKGQIKTEIASARDRLKSDLEVFSRELAQKVLGRSLS